MLVVELVLVAAAPGDLDHDVERVVHAPCWPGGGRSRSGRGSTRARRGVVGRAGCQNARREHPEARPRPTRSSSSTSTTPRRPASCASAPKILVDGAVAAGPIADLPVRHLRAAGRWGVGRGQRHARRSGRGAGRLRRRGRAARRATAGSLIEPGKGVAADDLAAAAAVDPRPDAYWDRRRRAHRRSASPWRPTPPSAAWPVGAWPSRASTRPARRWSPARRPGRRGRRRRRPPTAPPPSPTGFDAGGRGRRLGRARRRPGRRSSAGEPGKPWAVFGVEADVLVVGSKPGVIDDDGRGRRCTAGRWCPSGPVPVTAKAPGRAAPGRRRRACPTSSRTAGPLFAGWPAAGAGDPADGGRGRHRRRRCSRCSATTTARCSAPATGPRPSCATWRDELPFGRPLA